MEGLRKNLKLISVSHNFCNELLDVDPQRDDDASPMSTYRCMLRPSWMISALQNKLNTSRIQFRTFLKKKILGSHVAVLVKTFPLMYQLLMQNWYWRSQGDFVFRHTETRGTERIQFRQFRTFWKCFTFLGFHGVLLVKTIPLMYQLLMSNEGVILTKLRWFQVFVKIRTFLKKNQSFGFPWCSTREDLSIDVSITNVGLILTKLRWFQLFVKSQNSNFNKKNQFLGYHCVVLVKTFPLMHQLLM